MTNLRTASTIATSIIHASKLDYCNSLFLNTDVTQAIQNALTCSAATKTPNNTTSLLLSKHSTGSRSLVETWRRVWGGRKNFRITFYETISILRRKFLMTF